MLHRNFAVGLLAVPLRHPVVVAALTSLLVHVGMAAALLVASAGDDREDAPELVVDMDLDIAPEAPGGFDPQASAHGREVEARDDADEQGAPGKAEPGQPAETILEPAPDLEAEERAARERAEQERAEKEKKEREEKEREEKERQAAAKKEREEKARLAAAEKAAAEKAAAEKAAGEALADAGPRESTAAVASDAGPESPAVAVASDAGPESSAVAAVASDAGPESPAVASASSSARAGAQPGTAAPTVPADRASARPGVAAADRDPTRPSAAPRLDAARVDARGTSGATNIAGAAGSTHGAGDAGSAKLPPGAAADLRAYSPDGDKLAVLLRYDRLRGTPWAALADAIVAPMPDYRSIVGHRKVALADLFQSLLISTRNPANVTATHMVARTHLGAAEIRRFLDHSLQHVTWQAVRGGALGRRESSEVKLDRDHRVYLIPSPGLVVLTAPKHLGVLAERPSGPRELDARAVEADLPPWLARARTVENEAGVDSGVIAVVTVGGLRRAEIPIPEVGPLPTPERFSLSLEMAKVGFYVRGTMAFDSPERAAQFETRLNEAKARMLSSRFTELMLRNLHAFHALKGLTLRRRGPLVTYATSISNADAQAAMKLAAEWARRFFQAPPDPEPVTPHPGVQAKPPGPAPRGRSGSPHAGGESAGGSTAR